MYTGFHHIGLKVRDFDASLKFYLALGGKEVFRFPMGNSGRFIALVEMAPGAVVEIIPSGFEEKEACARWAHIALAAPDCRKAYEKALAAGAVCASEPKDGMLGTMAVCNAFVLGPDGESIEFFQVK